MSLRVVFVTTSPSEVLSAVRESGHAVVGIVESASGRTGARPPARGVLGRALAATRRRFAPRRPTLRGVAAERGIAHLRTYRRGDPELVRFVRELRPDVIAVCGMTRLLEREVFEIPRHGAINLHPAALPRYRGANPFFWMYYNMDGEGGVTIHFLDEGEDTGDVIFEETYPIRPGARMIETQATAFAIGTRLLVRALDALDRGACPRTPQPRDVSWPRARRVPPAEVRSLVDWEGWPLERVWHLLSGTEGWIDALPPPPGWRRPFRWRVGRPVEGPTAGTAGSIGKDAEGFHVAHPRGKIRLAIDYDPARLARHALSRIATAIV
jgi:methionyl-tRNA formyltransferase